MSVFIGVAELDALVLLASRIPRTVALILVGVSMSVTGLLMQVLTRNRFVEPSTTGASDAATLALLFVPVANTVDDRPAPAPDAPPLVASIPIADTPLRIGVTFLPERDDMLVAADGLTADGVHDHELWLVPPGEGAQVQSLGVVAPGTQKRVHLDAGLAQSMRDGAQILLSREPLGGAPDKSAPGPVVAEGTLQKNLKLKKT